MGGFSSLASESALYHSPLPLIKLAESDQDINSEVEAQGYTEHLEKMQERVQ